MLPLLLAVVLLEARAEAAKTVTVVSASGEVSVRPAKAEQYQRISSGQQIEDRARLKTGKDGEATLRFADGSEAKVSPKSEIIVHAEKSEGDPEGATVFFGRVWSKVVKAVGGETAFEVRSANAVAGVRGTGFEVESNNEGKLDGKKKAGRDPDWDGWFSKRAKKLEREGVKVATELDGRLSRRWKQVEKLVRQQRALREEIEKLEARGRSGEDTQGELQTKLEELERVTERLVDMRARLEAAFGMFERWGAMASQGAIQNGEQVGSLAGNVSRIAADFADMIEEGTDQSEEGMDEMMDDMKKGPTLKQKKKSAADELLK